MKEYAFNREKLEKEVLDAVVKLFNSRENEQRDISFVADALGISALKARKLLITAGERNHMVYYSSPLSEQIRKLYAQGKTVREIGNVVGLSHASVIGYLPYSKTVYSMREISRDAQRIRRCRERVKLCEEFMDCVAGMDIAEEEDYLWQTLVRLAGCVFRTSGRNGKGGVKFTYSIKLRKDGTPGGELKVDRKEKTITRASVMLAYKKAKTMGVVPGPKALGGIFGASYLYPIFLRLGACRAE